MTHTTDLVALINAVNCDIDEAHEDAIDAYRAIEALQSTATWQVLPISVRRQLCATHALLGGIADELAGV